jgi:hypothetical protein
LSNLQPMEPSDEHGLLIMGTENLFCCHLPMFFTPQHSYQTILEIALDGSDMETFRKIRKENPTKPLTIFNHEKMLLEDIVHSTSFSADAFFAGKSGDPLEGSSPFLESRPITVKRVLLFERLNPNTAEYPENLTYYLYGKGSEFHMSHVLTKARNFQQELDVTLSDSMANKINKLNQLTKITIPSLQERTVQPITLDPLSQSEYNIRMDDGTTDKVLFGNKFWINNGDEYLNMPPMGM